MRKHLRKSLACVLALVMVLGTVGVVSAETAVSAGTPAKQTQTISARAMGVNGDYLYAVRYANSNGKAQLEVYHLSNPNVAVTSSEATDLEFYTTISSEGMLIHDGYLYVAAKDSYTSSTTNDSQTTSHMIRKYSLADPTKPVLVGKYANLATTGAIGKYEIGTNGFAIYGNYLFASTMSRLGVYDISQENVTTPVKQMFDFGGAYEDITVYGDYAFMTNGNEVWSVNVKTNAPTTTWAADLSNCSTKQVIATVTGFSKAFGCANTKLCVDNGWLYFGSSTTKAVYRVNIADGVTANETVYTVWQGTDANNFGYEVDDDVLYVYGTTNTLYYKKLEANESFTNVNTFATATFTEINNSKVVDIQKSGNKLLLENNYSIHILPISEVSLEVKAEEKPSLNLETAIVPDGQPMASAVYNNILYVSYRKSSTGGVYMYDITNPAAPVLKNTVELLSTNIMSVDGHTAMIINDGYLYAAFRHSDTAFYIEKYKLDANGVPQYVTTYGGIGRSPVGMAVSNGYLYASAINWAKSYIWLDDQTATTSTKLTYDQAKQPLKTDTIAESGSTNKGQSMSNLKLIAYDGAVYGVPIYGRTVIRQFTYNNSEFIGQNFTTNYLWGAILSETKEAAYMLSENGELLVADLSEGVENINTIVNTVKIPGDLNLGDTTLTNYEMQVQGDYLYLSTANGHLASTVGAAAAKGVYLFDITDRLNPYLVSVSQTPQRRPACNMVVDNNGNVYLTNKTNDSTVKYLQPVTLVKEVVENNAQGISLPATFTGTYKGDVLTVLVNDEEVTPVCLNGTWSYTLTEGSNSATVKVSCDGAVIEKSYNILEETVVASYLTGEDFISASVNFVNKESEPIDILCAVACYSENGMIDIDCEIKTVDAFDSMRFSPWIAVQECDRVAMFVWESESLRPITMLPLN